MGMFGPIGDVFGGIARHGPGRLAGHVKGGFDKLTGGFDRQANAPFKTPDEDGALRGQADKAGGFADQTQGDFLEQGQALRDRLNAIASGGESISAKQLEQGLQRNLAQQQAMAAGARGGNQLAMARLASMNAANLGSGLAGQQALAGIQERQAANQALAALRGQDLQAALGGRSQAIGGLGDIERARTARFAAAMGAPTQGEILLGGLGGLLGGLGG